MNDAERNLREELDLSLGREAVLMRDREELIELIKTLIWAYEGDTGIECDATVSARTWLDENEGWKK